MHTSTRVSRITMAACTKREHSRGEHPSSADSFNKHSGFNCCCGLHEWATWLRLMHMIRKVQALDQKDFQKMPPLFMHLPKAQGIPGVQNCKGEEAQNPRKCVQERVAKCRVISLTLASCAWTRECKPWGRKASRMSHPSP